MSYKINAANIKDWTDAYSGELFDGVLCDPPYELGFMGKSWDSSGIAYDVEMWRGIFKLLKPGAHLLAFSGSRTYHRMAVAIEDAGFEIRDMIEWVYGSGFPKSLNIGKAVDRLGGSDLSWFIDYVMRVARKRGVSNKELTMLFPSKNGNPTGWLWNKRKGTQNITPEQYNKLRDHLELPFSDFQEAERELVGRGRAGLTSGNIANFTGEKEFDITKGTSEWEGYGTALKPAHEPCVLARKPLDGTVANNALKHGTGGLNIDGSRVEIDDNDNSGWSGSQAVPPGGSATNAFGVHKFDKVDRNKPTGRFPANLIHDGSDEVEAVFPQTKAGVAVRRNKGIVASKNVTFNANDPTNTEDVGYGDSGSASRYFYCAKASRGERNAGLDGFEEKRGSTMATGEGGGTMLTGSGNERSTLRANHHPTVKPLALTKYLATLIKPPKGGRLLVPFSGSGSEMIGALQAGWDYVEGVELTQEYIPIAEARIRYWLDLIAEENKQLTII